MRAHKTLLLLLLLTLALPSLTSAQARRYKQHNFIEDHFAVFAPEGWFVTRLYEDTSAALYGFQSPQRLQAILHVLRLDQAPYKGEKFAGPDLLEHMGDLAEAHSLSLVKGKGAPAYILPGCTKTVSRRYVQKNKRLVELIGCHHAPGERYLVWRVAIPMLDPDAANAALRTFAPLASNAIVLLSTNNKPVATPPNGFVPIPNADPDPHGPDPGAPNTPTPDDKNPGTPTPDDKKPDAPTPGDKNPDAPTPGDKNPDAPTPGDKNPGAPTPDNKHPD